MLYAKEARREALAEVTKMCMLIMDSLGWMSYFCMQSYHCFPAGRHCLSMRMCPRL